MTHGWSLALCEQGLQQKPSICDTLVGDFFNKYSFNMQPVLVGFFALPPLLGVFVGAPLLARELESGTFRLIWTQSVTRLRWPLTKTRWFGVCYWYSPCSSRSFSGGKGHSLSAVMGLAARLRHRGHPTAGVCDVRSGAGAGGRSAAAPNRARDVRDPGGLCGRRAGARELGSPRTGYHQSRLPGTHICHKVQQI